jgi:1-acyl-sn-glycerol-3-phosphate acyltransferase
VTSPEAERRATAAPLSLPQTVAYHIVREVVVAFCRLFWRVRVDGRQHIPARGPFILAPVHRSNIDTPLVAAVSRRRRLRYMGKDAMWKYPWSAWFFTSLGGFPVHRGSADREALRNAITVLERGEPLVLFPEGTRQSGPVVSEVFDGAAYVASRTGAPIVPVGIGGSEQAMPKGARMIRPVRLHMVIGPPIPAPAADEPGKRVPRRAVRETTERLVAELQDLFDEAQARAGTPNPPR